MNRDAKIGVVVILIIVGLLVIIWGRERGNEPMDADLTNATTDNTDEGLIVNRLDMRPSRAVGLVDSSITAVSPDNAPLVVSNEEIAVPPIPEEVVVTPPAPVAPPPAPKPKKWHYTVGANDSLIKIARDQLGDPNRWGEIAKLNNLTAPYAIRVGQHLTMPPKKGAATTITTDAVTTDTTTAAPVAPSGTYRKYTVQDGDSLVLIALEQLHDQAKWKKIADINRLAKPYRIKPGQVILLPE